MIFFVRAKQIHRQYGRTIEQEIGLYTERNTQKNTSEEKKQTKNEKHRWTTTTTTMCTAIIVNARCISSANMIFVLLVCFFSSLLRCSLSFLHSLYVFDTFNKRTQTERERETRSVKMCKTYTNRKCAFLAPGTRMNARAQRSARAHMMRPSCICNEVYVEHFGV